MKKYFFLVIIILLHFSLSFSQTFQWVRNNSHSITFNPDNALYPSTNDASGNFIICTIHNFKLIYSSSYFGDVIFRKYNSSGSEILSKIITGKVVINKIQTDANNNIYILRQLYGYINNRAGQFFV